MSELFIWQSYDLSRSWQSLPCHGGPKYLQSWSQSVQPQFFSCSPITSPLIPPLSLLSPLFQGSTSYQGFSAGWAVKYFFVVSLAPHWLHRDQREWVFEVREVKSENTKLSLFFEKCKVKKKCFHSFSRSAKWNQNAFTLFREVKSEIKMLRDRDREVKILENS